MDYTPAPIVSSIHDWKRFNAAHGLRPGSNVFNPDWASDAGRDYIESVLSISGVYFALGAIFFLVFAALYVAGICCARKRAAAAPAPTSPCCGLFGPRLWYLGSVVVLLAATAAAFGKLGGFRSAVTDLATAANSFDSLLSNTSTTVSTGLVPSLAGLQTSLQTFKTAAQSAAPPASGLVIATIQQMIDATSSASGASISFSSQINSTSASISSKVSGDDGIGNTVGRKVFNSAAIALGLFLGMLAFSTLGLLSNKCSYRLFAVCNAALVATILCTFVFAGLFAAVSIVASDLCVAPSTGIVAVTQSLTSDASVVDTVTFYTTCGNGTYVAPMGAYAQVVNGSAYLDGAQDGLDAIKVLLTGDNRFDTNIASAQAGIAGTNSTLQGVIAAVGCAPIYGIYSQVLKATCSEATPAAITVWALGSAACALIFFMVVSAARLCFNHPGNKDGDAPPGYAGGAGTVYVASPTGILPTHAAYTGGRVIADGSALGYATPVPGVGDWAARK